jgi:hypothetical protein
MFVYFESDRAFLDPARKVTQIRSELLSLTCEAKVKRIISGGQYEVFERRLELQSSLANFCSIKTRSA